MGTTFGLDDKYIFDDIVLNTAWKMSPSDKRVAKLAKKAKGIDKHGQWRGLSLMYEAFRSHGWVPNLEMVKEESHHAITTLTDNWKDREEAEIRLNRMRDHMLNPYGISSKEVECPFCVPNDNGLEFAEGETPCLICNGLGIVNKNKEIDCLWCSEPYIAKTLHAGGFRFTNVPCSECGGTHRITIEYAMRMK